MTSAGRLLEGRYGRPAAVSETVSGILSRRCIRRYADRPVPLLDALLACVQSAPSKSDLQQSS